MTCRPVLLRIFLVCLSIGFLPCRLLVAAEAPGEFAIGGCGGAYFLAAPGELTIDVYKRDLNRSGRTAELRAILVGPDRQVLQESVIPDDGAARGTPGPWQQIRLTTQVERQGVFGLNITVSQDRYGDEIAWGFRTNCPKYLIETSRGHRDERRREPIVLRNPGRPGNVCFVPRLGAFSIEVNGLADDVAAIPVFDAEDRPVGCLAVSADGTAAADFPADLPRDAVPWQMRFESQQATIHIDGVTQWVGSDRYANLPCWTPDATSYFPLLDYRWLLTPYHQVVHGTPGGSGTAAFQVHNNSNRPVKVQLDLEFPGPAWPVRLASEQLDLRPQATGQVTATYDFPADGEVRTCHLRATPLESPEFSTYSTLCVRSDEPRAAKPLDMPIQLQAYRHENELFGYLPDFPTDNQVYFDLDNQPLIRSGGSVAGYRNGMWQASNLKSSIAAGDGSLDGASCSMTSSKIAFDAENDLYVLGSAAGRPVLLRSSDGGRSYSAHPIPGRAGAPCTFDIEQPSGQNTPTDPPPIVRFTRTAVDPKLRWRRVHDLELILPAKRDGGFFFGEPVLISRNCIGLSSHSGIPSSVVSRGSRVHVAWGEATEPGEQVPGVPTFVATYDRDTGKLSEPALVGYGPPANDVHNSPSITIDSRGYLHVLCGTHGQPFPYARSLASNDAAGGWTDPEPVGKDARQTYLGLVCGADDTLHLVFRMWQYRVEPHPASHHATLAYQRKRPDQPWEPPRVLVVAPFSEYSIFYHRLTTDRLGRLFLSYDYWSTYWFYRTDHFGDRRSLLMSADGGDTWKLAVTADLRPGD